MLHQSNDLRDGALAKGLCGAHSEYAREVHTTRDHLVAYSHLARQRLSCQGNSIQGTRTLDNHTIQGHLLARTNHDDGAHLDNLWRNILNSFSPSLLLSFQMRYIWSDIHQMGNAVAALTLGIALEELAYLEEEHHEDCLRELGLSPRQKAYSQGTNGSDRHQEVLIKGIAL